MRIVPTLDELEHGAESLLLRAEALAIEQFALQGSRKTLTEGIHEAIYDRSHRGSDTRFPGALAEGNGGLAPLIGVVDLSHWVPLPDGHFEGVEEQVGALVGCRGPAHHSPAPGIHNASQVQGTCPGRDVRDTRTSSAGATYRPPRARSAGRRPPHSRAFWQASHHPTLRTSAGSAVASC
jgi:hypothetical protein